MDSEETSTNSSYLPLFALEWHPGKRDNSCGTEPGSPYTRTCFCTLYRSATNGKSSALLRLQAKEKARAERLAKEPRHRPSEHCGTRAESWDFPRIAWCLGEMCLPRSLCVCVCARVLQGSLYCPCRRRQREKSRQPRHPSRRDRSVVVPWTNQILLRQSAYCIT